MLSYSEALKRPAPATPLILKDFKENNVKEDQISLNLNEDSFYLDGSIFYNKIFLKK